MKITKKKNKILQLSLIIFTFILLLIPVFWHFYSKDNVQARAVSVSGDTAISRVTFLKSFGWEVSNNAPIKAEITIPNSFNQIYNDYNDLQKLQGYDLSKYKGKSVTKYTYEITNYPVADDGSSSYIVANLLVYDGKIIGGDICSMELGGFIHGFALT